MPAPAQHPLTPPTEGYVSTQGRLIRILERLTSLKERDIPPEYLSYGIPSPWLHAKCLRALQYFPAPELSADRTLLTGMLAVRAELGAGAEGGAGREGARV